MSLQTFLWPSTTPGILGRFVGLRGGGGGVVSVIPNRLNYSAMCIIYLEFRDVAAGSRPML
jgi:hypothetical protein